MIIFHIALAINIILLAIIIKKMNYIISRVMETGNKVDLLWNDLKFRRGL
jgi:hypothetical protein